AGKLGGRDLRAIRSVTEHVLAVRKGRREREARRRTRDRGSPARGERVAEVDLGRRLPLLAAAEGDEEPDDRADDEPDEQQPPARDRRPPEPTEVDLLLGVEVARALALLRAGAHRAAT